MTALATLFLSLAGLAGLALSMHRHHLDLLGRLPSRTNKLALNIAGWVLLASSVVPPILSHGLSLGIVLWFGIATVASLIVTMGLTYGPRPAHRPQGFSP